MMPLGRVAMSVRVCDFKGDGSAWIIIQRKGRRRARKIGDWEKAHRIAKEIEAEELRGRAGLPEPLPLRIILTDYREGHVKTLKYSTQLLQRGQINNHLVPALGDIDARDLREVHVEQFIHAKLQTYSPAFVRSCINLLNKALRQLRRAHPDIPPLNLEVAEIFERAEDSRAEEIRSIDSWTHDDAAKLLEIVRANEPRWYPLVLTLLHTGCRRGEALGMQWPDVDFRRKRITIRRARVNSRTVLPKHRKRKDKPRTVVITPAMADALRGLQTFRYRRSGGWVFASRNGTAIEGTTVFRAWSRIREKLAERNIRTLTMHSLRHTFATLSLEDGRSVKWVSQQLGHRKASLTFDTYSHALPDEEVDLSYLPIAGDVTTSHPGVTSTTLRRVEDSISI